MYRVPGSRSGGTYRDRSKERRVGDDKDHERGRRKERDSDRGRRTDNDRSRVRREDRDRSRDRGRRIDRDGGRPESTRPSTFQVNIQSILGFIDDPGGYINNVRKTAGDTYLNRLQFSVYLLKSEAEKESRRGNKAKLMYNQAAVVKFAAHLFIEFFNEFSQKPQSQKNYKTARLMVVNFSKLPDHYRMSVDLIRAANLSELESRFFLEDMQAQNFDAVTNATIALIGHNPGKNVDLNVLADKLVDKTMLPGQTSRSISNGLYYLGNLAKLGCITRRYQITELEAMLEALKRSQPNDQDYSNAFYGVGLAARADIWVRDIGRHAGVVLSKDLVDDVISKLLSNRNSLAIQNFFYGLGLAADEDLWDAESFKINEKGFFELLEQLTAYANRPNHLSISVHAFGLCAYAQYFHRKVSVQNILRPLLRKFFSLEKIEPPHVNQIMIGFGRMAKVGALKDRFLNDDLLAIFDFVLHFDQVDYEVICSIVPSLGEILENDAFEGGVDVSTVGQFLLKFANRASNLAPRDVSRIIFGLGKVAKSGHFIGSINLHLIEDYLEQLIIDELDGHDIYQILYGIGLMVEYQIFGVYKFDFFVNNFLKKLTQHKNLRPKQIARVLLGVGLCSKNSCLRDGRLDSAEINALLVAFGEAESPRMRNTAELLKGMADIKIYMGSDVRSEVNILEGVLLKILTAPAGEVSINALASMLSDVAKQAYANLWCGQIDVKLLNDYVRHFFDYSREQALSLKHVSYLLYGVVNSLLAGLWDGFVDVELLFKIIEEFERLLPKRVENDLNYIVLVIDQISHLKHYKLLDDANLDRIHFSTIFQASGRYVHMLNQRNKIDLARSLALWKGEDTTDEELLPFLPNKKIYYTLGSQEISLLLQTYVFSGRDVPEELITQAKVKMKGRPTKYVQGLFDYMVSDDQVRNGKIKYQNIAIEKLVLAWCVDLYFEVDGHRFIVEFDGEHHYHKGQLRIKDAIRDEFLKGQDFHVIRLGNVAPNGERKRRSEIFSEISSCVEAIISKHTPQVRHPCVDQASHFRARSRTPPRRYADRDGRSRSASPSSGMWQRRAEGRPKDRSGHHEPSGRGRSPTCSGGY